MKPIDISMLGRRAIEAEMAAALIEGFEREIGRQRAMEVAGSVVRGLARKAGRQMAEAAGDSGLATLARLIREVWGREDAMVLHFLEESPTVLHFQVLRCGYADQYEAMGLKAFGYCLSCNRDGAFIEGFNPDVRLERSRTIMEGASLCDFRYWLVR
jgi:hypothetical protein